MKRIEKRKREKKRLIIKFHSLLDCNLLLNESSEAKEKNEWVNERQEKIKKEGGVEWKSRYPHYKSENQQTAKAEKDWILTLYKCERISCLRSFIYSLFIKKLQTLPLPFFFISHFSFILIKRTPLLQQTLMKYHHHIHLKAKSNSTNKHDILQKLQLNFDVWKWKFPFFLSF